MTPNTAKEQTAKTETQENGVNKTAENNSNDSISVKSLANHALGQVKEKTAGVLDEQKENLTSGLKGVADSIRKVGENLRDTDEQNKVGEVTAQYGDAFAQQIEKLTNYVENANLRDLMRDGERFARQQPAIFIGAAFAVGFLAARFLKSSSGASKNIGNSNRQSAI